MMGGEIEGLSPADEELLDKLSHDKIIGEHKITISVTLPPDDYDRLYEEEPELIEKFRQEAWEEAFKNLPDDFLASNEQLRLEIQIVRRPEDD